MITVAVDGADVVAADLSAMPLQVRRANARAINRALLAGRTEAVQLIAKDTGLKSSDIKKAFTTRKASPNLQHGQLVTTKLKRIPLIAFGARGPEPSRGKGQGVRAGMRGKRRRYPDAFIANVTTGHELTSVHKGVFYRVVPSKKRSELGWSKNLPIKQLFGPSLGYVFKRLRPQVVARMAESYDTTIAHELERLRHAE